MKKFRILMALLVMMTLLFAACGGGEDQAQADGDESKDEGPVTVTVAAGAVGQELELCKQAAAAYEKENPNVNVEVLETPDMATDRLGLYLQFFESKSSKVDLYQIDVIWPGDLAQHFVDLYDYGANSVVDQHFAPIIKNNTVDGDLVAMPWFTDAPVLYYRTDLMEKYGYSEPPKSWSKLEEIAAKVQAGERDAGNQDFWGFVWQGNSYEGLTCDANEWVVSNGGGSIVDRDGNITINNQNAADALDMAVDWVGTISPNGVLGYDEEGSRAVWQAGNSMFMRNWPYAYSLGNADDSVIKGKFDVSPLPSGPNGDSAATLGGWQLALSKYSENKEAAADVLMYLTGYEEQKRRAIVGSYNPTIKALYDDEEVLEAVPFFGSLYDVFTNTAPRPSTQTAPQYAEVSKIFYTNVHKVLSGDLSGDEAVNIMERELKNLLK